mgnify:FL=1|jgi:hypothetical protein
MIAIGINLESNIRGRGLSPVELRSAKIFPLPGAIAVAPSPMFSLLDEKN